jgi:hypothetical protein
MGLYKLVRRFVLDKSGATYELNQIGKERRGRACPDLS